MTEITQLITQESNELNEYNVDQSVICKRQFLKHLNGIKTRVDVPTYEKDSLPNMFYPHTEGIDVTRRYTKLNVASSSTLSFIPESKSTITLDELTEMNQDPYGEEESEEMYLKSTPVSFCIISKPNIGETELAKLLVKYWKCVLITPETVLREEIASDSRVGRCINFNLQNGRAIGPQVLLRLVQRRIKSQTACHRGFVLAGFPLIPNQFYQDEPLSSESAVFNVEEIFEDIFTKNPPDFTDSPSTMKGSKVSLDVDNSEDFEENTLEEQVEIKKLVLPPEKKIDPPDLGSESANIIKLTESFACLLSVENQMEFLFKMLKNPVLLIYVFCGNMDVVNKIEKYRFNLLAEREVSLYKESADTVFSKDLPSAINLLDTDEDDDEIDLKNMVKLPVHLNTSISEQLKLFKFRLLPIIDEKVLIHDPQHFIKVDGRLSANKIFYTIRSRLKTLGFQPVLIPEKLSNPDEIEGELAEETSKIIESQTHEEMFNKYRGYNVVSPMFKWQLSNWGYKCPVALKRGVVVNGSPENAVRFMNKIFFLSDDGAVLNFCRNPRPYLIPIKPKPPHRVFIIGPKYSGKSAVSKCLSFLFNCALLQLNVLEEEYKHKKTLEYLEKVRTAAIAEGLIALEEMRERDKEQKINFWMKNTYALLKAEFPDLVSKSRVEIIEPDGKVEVQSLESDVSLDKSVASNISERTHSEILIELEKINLPISDKIQIKALLEDKNKLLDYLPEDLQKPIKAPTVFDSFVTEYVNDVLENSKLDDDTLSTDEIVDMFQTAIKNVEHNNAEKNCGWIIDGFPPNLDILKELPVDVIADEIICLKDQDPKNAFLLERFAKNETAEFRGFKRFFKDLKRFSAAERVPLCMGSSYALISRVSNIYSSKHEQDDTSSERKESIEEYVAHLNEFDSKWAAVRTYFTSICNDPPIEINIANKQTPELLLNCILQIENKYRRTASVLTEDEKIQEAKDFGGNFENASVEEEEVGEEEPPSTDNYSENRRYGNTNVYCPIAFFDHFVLWKGSEHFTAQFENKLYFLSSERALHSFVDNPRKYLTNLPAQHIPPPRICIVGPIGCGKSTLAKKLAHNFGLFYINFEKLILDAFDLDVTQKIDDLINKSMTELNDNGLVHSEEIEILKQYLEGDELLPEHVLKNILNSIWFDNPYKTTGFILDNFPRRNVDIKYMTNNFYIPDAVIELQANQEQIHSRIFQLKLDAWQEDVNERKRLKAIEDANIMSKWEKERKERIQILVETIKEERKDDFIRSQPPVPPYSSPVDSSTTLPMREETEEEELNMFIYDPAQELEDLQEIKQKVEQDLPRPEFDVNWESFEEASEKIETLIGQCYVRDINALENIIVLLKSNNIEFASFPTNKPVVNVFNQLASFIEKFKFRNRSLFERVYSVTVDVAEKLLEQGYYFLSKFGRTCPVQVYEKKNPIQMFLSQVHKMSIFPVIHRRYIYFICGSVHLDKFKRDPLLYVENEDYELPLFPLKIAIIGPPKSGKSILAEKFQKELGLKVITRGQAIRYVLKNLQFCELAQNMSAVLKKGWSLTTEMVAGAVEAVTLDGKSIAQGFVLDGFPDSVDELKHLICLGILPYVFLDVLVEPDKIEECTLNEIGKKQMRPLSYEFIKYRYSNWLKENIKMHTWLEKEYQNIYKISRPDSKWQIWSVARNIAFSNLFNILNYYKTKNQDIAYPMKSLLISSSEFERGQSAFKNFCPCCLRYSNHLVTGGNVPDRNGVIQFRNYYYWVCNTHFLEFMSRPQKFLPPESEAMLPNKLPCPADSGCEHSYQSGICIVTYWDSRPKTVIKYGISRYTVFFKHKCYMFCSEECMNKFLKQPYEYFDKISYFREPVPLELKETLPTLGYLQQYVATLLIKAIVYTETLRPVHPCMDISTSAIMNIALYLKINNPKRNADYLQFYEEFKRKFDERREKVKDLITMFTVTENPFLCFDDSYYG